MNSGTTSIVSWPAGGLRRRAGLRARKGGSDGPHATPSTAKQGGHARTLGRVVSPVKTPHHIKISVTEQEVVHPSHGYPFRAEGGARDATEPAGVRGGATAMAPSTG